MEEKVNKYIRNTLAKGFTRQQVYDALIHEGYKPEFIKKAFIDAMNPPDIKPAPPHKSAKHTKEKVKTSKTHTTEKFNLPIIALVLSLLFFIPFAPLAGFILGIVSLVKISKDKSLKGTGLAIAAIVISVLQIILIIAFLSMASMALSLVRNIFGPSFLLDPSIMNASFDGSFCGDLDGIQMDMCYMEMAELNGDGLMCSSIRAEETKYVCIKSVAVSTSDSSVCNLITDSNAKGECLSALE